MASDPGLLQRLLLQQQANKEQSDESAKFKRKAQAILDQLLPMQRDLVLSPFKRIAALTAGRVGKTFSVRARLFLSALLKPGTLNVYIGLTRLKARQEIWDGSSGIVALCDKLGLKEPDVYFNRQELLFRVPALGSTIMCGGADDLKTIETYRGGPGYDEVWIDEAKSHDAHLLDVLIDDILVPRINARNGVLGICGTPGSILSGQFFEITRTGSERSIPYGEPNDPVRRIFSLHRWNLAMNTSKVPETDKTIWELALIEKQDKGWTDQNAKWLREYMGQWAADSTDFVYRFRPYTDDGREEFNLWTPKPRAKENPFGLPTVLKLETGDATIKWNFAIGLDLGSVDPCAIQILAFSEQHKRIYQAYEWYHQTLNLDVLCDALDEAVKMVQAYTEYPVAIVGDTAAMGTTILEHVRVNTGHRVDPAHKADKVGFVGLVNDDLVDGRLKLLKERECAKQMAELQWDESGKRENKAQRNDAADALLYARGAIIRYLTHENPVADAVKTPEEAHLEQVFSKMGGRRDDSTEYEPGTYIPD